MIFQARNHLDPTEIFKGEIEENMIRVKTAEQVLQCFKETYEEYRLSLNKFFPDNVEPALWQFSPNLVFERFDRFMDRVIVVKVT